MAGKTTVHKMVVNDRIRCGMRCAVIGGLRNRFARRQMPDWMKVIRIISIPARLISTPNVLRQQLSEPTVHARYRDTIGLSGNDILKMLRLSLRGIIQPDGYRG